MVNRWRLHGAQDSGMVPNEYLVPARSSRVHDLRAAPTLETVQVFPLFDLAKLTWNRPKDQD